MYALFVTLVEIDVLLGLLQSHHGLVVPLVMKLRESLVLLLWQIQLLQVHQVQCTELLLHLVLLKQLLTACHRSIEFISACVSHWHTLVLCPADFSLARLC